MPDPTDRREAIAAAFEAAENAAKVEVPETKVEVPETKVEVPETKVEVPETKVEAPETPETKAETKVAAPETKVEAPEYHEKDLDKAPQSWKPAEKAKWATLDPDIRQEVLRRERQVTQALNETAQARSIANEFAQTVQPYMARIQSLGVQPVQAVGELLKADYLLSSAPPPQRAAFMAKLIQDYGVDIQQLDLALSGQSSQVDPVQAKVDELLQQRLAPLNDFVKLQKQQVEEAERQRAEAAAAEVAAMSANTTEFPHFERVRDQMADWIEFAQKKNIHMDLKTAYNKAIMSDPELSQLVVRQQQTLSQAAQAQRAKQASVSVSGAPSVTPRGSPPATDRRAIIAQAFDNLASR